MSVKFEKNDYLRVFKSKSGIEDVVEHAKKHQEFNAGMVSFSDFQEGLKGKGWFGRKITALPHAAWSGVVKTAFHLAMALLGVLKAVADDGQYLKVQLFCAIRDIQEGCGWIIGFFYDSYGQFLVQEGLFHKSYYECFLEGEERSYSPVGSPEASPYKYKSASPVHYEMPKYEVPKYEVPKSPKYEAPKFDSLADKYTSKVSKHSVDRDLEKALEEEYDSIRKFSAQQNFWCLQKNA